MKSVDTLYLRHNIGSGKSLSATRLIAKRMTPTFTNYKVSLPNVTRLKVDNVITHDLDVNGKKGKPRVNFAFWKEQISLMDGFDIVLDEAHNLLHSRRAMSSWNINMTIWISQIRKILGTNERNDILLITQVVPRLDVAFRDLLFEIILCEKHEGKRLIPTKVMVGKKLVVRMMPEIKIVQNHFVGENCVQNYEAHKAGVPKCYSYRDYFIGNKYMQFYDSYELIEFGDTEFL